MNKVLYFILLFLILSCQKAVKSETNETVKIDSAKIPTPILINDNERTLAIDSSQIRNLNNELVFNLYKSSNFQTVWTNLNKRKFILEQLKNSEEFGLNPNDYHYKQLQNFENNISHLSDDDLIKYDLYLTQYFQKFLIHLYKGKLSPKELYSNWDLKPKDFNINEVLISSFNQDNLKEAITKCQPKNETYKRLLNALKLINKFPEDKTDSIFVETKITLNDTNPELLKIIKKLQFWKDLEITTKPTSIYDFTILDGVKKFQLRHGLTPDGIIGKGTIAALNVSKETRKHQIIANLERWRWYPDSLSGNYFIVNIPNYSLKVVEDRDTVLSRNVVVGSNSRRTPILSSTLKTVIFNPTWTVPPTILKEDIVPAMKKNRNYLAKKNIEIFDSNGHLVNPADWNENKPFAYRYVQKPGYSNSLGIMKILFPNNHSVYLHDTNHRNVFNRQNRSLSSGCVRIEEPLALAKHLLNDSIHWSAIKIDSIIASQKTTGIRIPKKYAIYQWYWTAWSEKNTLYFRRDIYKLDAELYSKLRN